MTPKNNNTLNDEFAKLIASADHALLAKIILAIQAELEAIPLSPCESS
jgi:hypothetical protein